MLAVNNNSIKESSFNSTTSKQIQTILPYGKHQPNEMETVQKTQEDVIYFGFIFVYVDLISLHRFFLNLSTISALIPVKMSVQKWLKPLMLGYKYRKMSWLLLRVSSKCFTAPVYCKLIIFFLCLLLNNVDSHWYTIQDWRRWRWFCASSWCSCRTSYLWYPSND